MDIVWNSGVFQKPATVKFFTSDSKVFFLVHRRTRTSQAGSTTAARESH